MSSGAGVVHHNDLIPPTDAMVHDPKMEMFFDMMKNVSNMLNLMQLIGAECSRLFSDMLFSTFTQVWAQHMLWMLEVCKHFKGTDKVIGARLPDINYWVRWTSFYTN